MLFKNLVNNKDLKLSRLILVIFISIFFWNFLHPVSGLSIQALHMIIIFVSAMVGIILEVGPPIICLLLAMLAGNLTGVIEPKDSFSGFSNIVPCLLFAILSLSIVITKTSIGIRLAYIFMKYFGRGIIGLSYSIELTEFFMSAILPSNTARGASIGYPLVTSLSKYISSQKKETSESSVGGYLSLLYAYSNSICSGLFLTAMISNAIIVETGAKYDINLSWITWAKFTIIPSICILLILPFILRIICNPKVDNLETVREEANKNYKNLGKLTKEEKFIISIFLGMLSMWIFSEYINIPIIVTTLLGLSIFLIFGILDIKEMLSSYSTFNAVIILGILISFVNRLISLGAIDWFNTVISSSLTGIDKDFSFLILAITYFFTHYFFTGEGGRIIALYTPFLVTGLALGIDKFTVAMTLAVFSSLSDVVAHYTCPTSLMLFSTGYLPAKKWMFCGLIMSIIVLTIWFTYIKIFI